MGVGGTVQDPNHWYSEVDDLGRVANTKYPLEKALAGCVSLAFEREASKAFYHRQQGNEYRDNRTACKDYCPNRFEELSS